MLIEPDARELLRGGNPPATVTVTMNSTDRYLKPAVEEIAEKAFDIALDQALAGGYATVAFVDVNEMYGLNKAGQQVFKYLFQFTAHKGD